MPIEWLIGDDPYAVVISANIHRRRLTADQKRELIANVLKAKPELSDRAIAKQVKADHKTVAKVRAKKKPNGELPHKDRTEASGRKARGRKAKAPDDARIEADKAEVRELWSKVQAAEVAKADYSIGEDGRLSMPDKLPKPKAEQKTFDSPQAAHASKPAAPMSLDLGSLAFAWREVEAHAAAGNKQRLKGALQHLLKEVSGVLASMRKGGA